MTSQAVGDEHLCNPLNRLLLVEKGPRLQLSIRSVAVCFAHFFAVGSLAVSGIVLGLFDRRQSQTHQRAF